MQQRELSSGLSLQRFFSSQVVFFCFHPCLVSVLCRPIPYNCSPQHESSCLSFPLSIAGQPSRVFIPVLPLHFLQAHQYLGLIFAENFLPLVRVQEIQYMHGSGCDFTANLFNFGRKRTGLLLYICCIHRLICEMCHVTGEQSSSLSFPSCIHNRAVSLCFNRQHHPLLFTGQFIHVSICYSTHAVA